MATLTVTSKRQATFPVDACRDMGLKPGDVIELESRMEGEERIWILRPHHQRRRDWVGCLRARAKGVDHSMEAVRKSIAAGRAGDAGKERGQ